MKNVSIRGPIKDFRTNLSSFFTGFHFQCAKLLDFCQKSNVAFFVLEQRKKPTKRAAWVDGRINNIYSFFSPLGGDPAKQERGLLKYLKSFSGH